MLKEAFKKEVEHIQKRSRKNTVKVDKGFYTKEQMKKDLGWSMNLISQFSHHIASIRMICSNTISFERGPRSERGPGSARARASRAPNWSFLRARARTQDPIHPEDLFQGKICYKIYYTTRHGVLTVSVPRKRIKAACAYCTHKSRVKTHVRPVKALPVVCHVYHFVMFHLHKKTHIAA